MSPKSNPAEYRTGQCHDGRHADCRFAAVCTCACHSVAAVVRPTQVVSVGWGCGR